MRNYTSSNISVDYPEELAWLLDNNFMFFRNIYGQYQMEVTVTVVVSGNTFVYNYTTEVGALTIRLNPLITSYCPGTFAVTWKAVTYDSSSTTYTDSGSYKMKAVFGKSLQERHHGSARIITYYEAWDVQPLELYIPQCFCGGVTYSNAVVNVNDSPDIISIQGSSIVPGLPAPVTNVRYNGKNPVCLGDIWAEESPSEWWVELRQVCPRKNGIKLKYWDTDGCQRWAIGEVLSKKMAAKRDDYRHGGSVFNDIPRSLVTGYDGTISVGFADVDPRQYLEDIMLSPRVLATRCDCGNGKAVDNVMLIPTTLTLTRDGNTKDIIISFKIDA